MIDVLSPPLSLNRQSSPLARAHILARLSPAAFTPPSLQFTRQGAQVVRHYLTEAVWQVCRLSPAIGAYRGRIQRDALQRRKIAVVANRERTTLR